MWLIPGSRLQGVTHRLARALSPAGVRSNGARFAAAAAAAAAAAPPRPASTLKAALRELYKRVHPDLFADFPPERAENERSFKLLQEYLSQARGGGGDLGPVARSPYRFVFFLRHNGSGSSSSSSSADADAQAQAPPGDGDEARSAGEDPGDPLAAAAPAAEGREQGAVAAARGEALRRTELTLPPPERGRGEGRLSPSSRKALARLLQLCGLPSAFEDEEGEGWEAGARLGLLEFLPGATEEARQREMRAVKSEVRAANLRGAMRLARQVIVGFGGREVADASGERQVQLLESLAGVLEGLGPEELAGCHIAFGASTALDRQGTLWLDASADPEEWGDFLAGVDLDYAAQRRRLVGAVRGLERGAAHAAGLAQLYTAQPFMLEDSYRSFLEGVAAHASRHGPVGVRATTGAAAGGAAAPAPPFSQLPVYVAPPAHAHSHGAGKPQGGLLATARMPDDFHVSESLGYVQVPMQAAAHQVYGFVLDQGPRALSALEAARRQAAELAAVVASTRQRLGLRRLTHDPLLPPSHLRACCKRMLAHRDVLQPLLEGLSVRVSDANRVAADGECIHVAWDFEL